MFVKNCEETVRATSAFIIDNGLAALQKQTKKKSEGEYIVHRNSLIYKTVCCLPYEVVVSMMSKLLQLVNDKFLKSGTYLQLSLYHKPYKSY